LSEQQEHVFVKNNNCRFPEAADEIAELMGRFDPANDVNWIDEVAE
jgi:hypothetical protein